MDWVANALRYCVTWSLDRSGKQRVSKAKPRAASSAADQQVAAPVLQIRVIDGGRTDWFSRVAAPCAGFGCDGPVGGDDVFGLGGGDRAAVGVTDHVGHLAAHHGPGAFGEVGSNYAEGAEVVFATLDHLHVVDPGELGVLSAGVVGGSDQ